MKLYHAELYENHIWTGILFFLSLFFFFVFVFIHLFVCLFVCFFFFLGGGGGVDGFYNLQRTPKIDQWVIIKSNRAILN